MNRYPIHSPSYVVPAVFFGLSGFIGGFLGSMLITLIIAFATNMLGYMLEPWHTGLLACIPIVIIALLIAYGLQRDGRFAPKLITFAWWYLPLMGLLGSLGLWTLAFVFLR